VTSGTTPDGWSAYDQAVPSVAGLDDLRDRMDELRPRRPGPAGATLDDVRQVVVVVSSSRGGSSLFGELLRRVPGLLHLRAEVNPFFALAGLSSGPRRRPVLEAELLADIGEPAGSGPSEVDERFVLDVTWRLLAQWPTLAVLPLPDLVQRVAAVAERTPAGTDPRRFQLDVLADLRRSFPEIHPAYYDLSDEVMRQVHPDLATPVGPPGPAFVEMPPFVVLSPWRRASREDLVTRPLVLTTPRNSFRLEFLAGLFPNATLRVLHLTRNPAAAVNGLVDGWLHHGFFNCTVPAQLRMPGYSDVVPGGDRWWCYDIPPRWPELVDRPLVEVCAEQWRSAHRAALAYVASHQPDVLRVRFESVVGPPAERLPTLDRLAGWLGVDVERLHAVAGAELPVVMATAPPRPRRWLVRAAELLPALRRPGVSDLAEELGYRSEEEWD
jgi:hypothetical protein